jgi:hypothetical protein
MTENSFATWSEAPADVRFFTLKSLGDRCVDFLILAKI